MTGTHASSEPVRGQRRPLVIGLVVVVLLAAGTASWWAQRPGSPTVLGDRTAVGFKADPRPLARSAGFAALALPGPGSREEVLTFHGAPSVDFTKNTAAATARVAVCVRASSQSLFGVGSVRDLDTACSEVRYVEDGTRLHWAESTDSDQMREYLIVVVTPTKQGVVTVDRVTYDYEGESGESGTDVGTLRYTIRAT